MHFDLLWSARRRAGRVAAHTVLTVPARMTPTETAIKPPVLIERRLSMNRRLAAHRTRCAGSPSCAAVWLSVTALMTRRSGPGFAVGQRVDAAMVEIARLVTSYEFDDATPEPSRRAECR
jgi:hypothetical protein